MRLSFSRKIVFSRLCLWCISFVDSQILFLSEAIFHSLPIILWAYEDRIDRWWEANLAEVCALCGVASGTVSLVSGACKLASTGEGHPAYQRRIRLLAQRWGRHAVLSDAVWALAESPCRPHRTAPHAGCQRPTSASSRSRLHAEHPCVTSRWWTRWHRHRCVAARYAYLGIAGVRWTSYNLEGDAHKGGAYVHLPVKWAEKTT